MGIRGCASASGWSAIRPHHGRFGTIPREAATTPLPIRGEPRNTPENLRNELAVPQMNKTSSTPAVSCTSTPGIPIDAQPYMPACRRLFEQGEHILIGVSPENSYFSRERIAALVKWAQPRFTGIDIIYVDQHIDTMYVASGYTPQKAASSATRTIRDTRRRVRQAVERAGGPGPQVRVRALSECMDLPSYQATRRRIEECLSADDQLRQACEEHVRYILRSRTDDSPASAGAEAEKLQAGLAYLFAEMPVLFNTPEILGVSSSVFCYHSIMPVLRHLYDSAIRHQAQGYIVVKPIEQELETRS
ncbi:hypothetical protein GCM10010177_20200 [Actinomadura citrea]|nr:hypothetical protein GCM10010177_20200 [Actinomadura citrea]